METRHTGTSGHRELYQEVILDHSRSPRNFRPLEDADRRADGHNPLCGDRITIALKLAGGRVADVRFEASGCAVSKASASLMTEAVKGLTVDQLKDLFDRFQGLLTDRTAPAGNKIPEKLTVFEGLRDHPARVKCAMLPWRTLLALVDGRDDAASSE